MKRHADKPTGEPLPDAVGAEGSANPPTSVPPDVNAAPEAAAPAPPEPPPSPLAEAEARLAAAEERRLRLAADFDNYRKRVHRDLHEARAAAAGECLAAFLNVFDHFRLAMAAADADPKVLRDGMAMILAEFEKAMEEAGVEVIDAVGQPFDPHLHEASAREHSATVPEGQVLRQWRCGYRLGERLMRPAAVVVSAGPQAVADAPDAASPDAPEGA